MDGTYTYIPTTSTVGYWKLNGNSNDSSTSANNGTDTSITYSTANSVFGQGAGFNGTTSKINLGNVGISGSSTITVSAWINRLTSTAQSSYFSAGVNSGTNLLLLSVNLSSTGEVTVEYVGGTKLTSPTGIIGASQWYNVVYVYDGGAIGTSTVHIYVNGIAKTLTLTGSGTPNLTNSNWAIGYFRASSLRFWPGNIDEVIVENRSWTAIEVAKYYMMSLGKFQDINYV